MPPTAGTPTLAAQGCTPVILQATHGQIAVPQTAHPSVYATHFQPVQIMQAQGALQMTDGWTTFVPISTQPPGQLVMQPLTMFPQGSLAGQPPVSVHQQSVVSVSPPANPFFNPLTNSTNMEIVWHGIFDQLFSTFYPDTWTLTPISSIPIASDYRICNDSAKVRFLCQTCGKAWTSMKGRVVFIFNLDRETKRGFVFFKLFGQQCQKCTPGTFEHAMWYPEEVQKVVLNIYHAVGKTYYGMMEAPVFRERRKGKPRTQHNSSLCQACADNICLESNFDRSLKL